MLFSDLPAVNLETKFLPLMLTVFNVSQCLMPSHKDLIVQCDPNNISLMDDGWNKRLEGVIFWYGWTSKNKYAEATVYHNNTKPQARENIFDHINIYTVSWNQDPELIAFSL